MNKSNLSSPLLALSIAMLFAATAQAQDADKAEERAASQAAQGLQQAQEARQRRPADVTMRILEEDEDASDLVTEIALPEDAADEAVEASAHGLATANEARADGREFGERTAEEARDRIKDDTAAGALENIPQEVLDDLPEEAKERIERARERARRGGGG